MNAHNGPDENPAPEKHAAAQQRCENAFPSACKTETDSYAKIIIAPDSFKGTLTASEVCEAIDIGVHKAMPGVQTVCIPLADGGEGLVCAMLAARGGRKVEAEVHGPWGCRVPSFYGVLENGTAVIEMAAAAGVALTTDAPDVLGAGTYGVGELINFALNGGARRIYLGLGGSATNDFGCGMAAALGARFLNAEGKAFVPVGATLKDVEHVDITGLSPLLKNADLTALCDVTNPLCGENGAARVYGPQKGADPIAVRLLDEGLRHIAGIVRKDMGIDILSLPGGGAAGGMGAGVVALLGGKLKPGVKTVLEATHFAAVAENARLVLTGEGRMDEQSAQGKVVSGVLEAAKSLRIPVVALCGGLSRSLDELYCNGLTAAFSIQRLPLPFEIAKTHSKENLCETTYNVIRCLFHA